MVDLLLDLWRQGLQPWIAPLWESARPWRVLFLGIITFMVGTFLVRRRLALRVLGLSTQGHDVAIFKAADVIANEPFLDGLLNRDVYQGRCELGDTIRLNQFTEYLARTEISTTIAPSDAPPRSSWPRWPPCSGGCARISSPSATGTS